MKQSSLRRLVNLFLVLTLVPMLWLIVKRPGLPSDSLATITDLQVAQIDRIRLSGTGVVALELRRLDGGWQLTSPAALPAHARQIRDLLDIPGGASFASYAIEEIDPALVGLSPPLATLWLNDVALDFGQRAPVEGYRYLRSDQQLQLISNAHHHTISRELADFVAPRLLPNGWELARIVLPAGQLTKDERGAWQTSGELRLPPGEAGAVATRWRDATAAAVQPWTPGLKIVGVVTLFPSHTDDGLTLLLEQMEDAPDFILARPDLGLRYHFSPEQGALLMAERSTGA